MISFIYNLSPRLDLRMSVSRDRRAARASRGHRGRIRELTPYKLLSIYPTTFTLQLKCAELNDNLTSLLSYRKF